MSGASAGDDSLTDLIREASALVRRNGREDLHERLTAAVRATAEAEVSVLVAGPAGAGKSSLLNALLGTSILPIGAPTMVTTIVRSGENQSVVHLADGPRIDGECADAAPWIINPSLDGQHNAICVELWPLARALADGLALVDSPSFDNSNATAGPIAEAVARRADALLFVTSAAAPLNREEIAFLARAAQNLSTLFLAVSHTDRHRGWRRVCEDNESIVSEHLPWLDAPSVVGISTRLKELADESGDEQLAEESGVHRLATEILTRVIGDRSRTRAANLLRQIDGALTQLETTLRSLQNSIIDGDDASVRAVKADVERTRAAGEEALVLLRDGFGMLRDAATTELTRRTRELSRRAGAAKTVEGVEEIAGDLAATLVAIADEFEQRCLELVENADAVRLGLQAPVPVEFAKSSPDGVYDEPSEPLRLRAAKTAASGGMGLALAAQRVVGGGDVLSAVLAIGALVGAATGVAALRSAKRSQDVATARKELNSAIEDARLQLTSNLRQRALSRQREVESAIKHQVRLDIGLLQAQLDDAARRSRADAATRQRATAATAAELDRLLALRRRASALYEQLVAQRSNPNSPDSHNA